MTALFCLANWPRDADSALSETDEAMVCASIYKDTSLVPQRCFDRLCPTDNELCSAEESCPNSYFRPYRYMFSNYMVDEHVLQRSNIRCECEYPQNVPSYLPLPLSPEDREAAMCFNNACGETGDAPEGCEAHCSTVRGWMTQGLGRRGFYRPAMFDVSTYERTCGVETEPEKKKMVASLAVLPVVLILCSVGQITASRYHRVPVLHKAVVLVVLALSVTCLVVGLISKEAESTCESHDLGVQSACKIRGFRVPNFLCGGNSPCECNFDEDCCKYCDASTTKNCPNITNSLTQKCSCECKSGQCINFETNTTAIIKSGLFTASLPTALIVIAVAIGVVWGGGIVGSCFIPTRFFARMYLALVCGAVLLVGLVSISLGFVIPVDRGGREREPDLVKGNCMAKSAVLQSGCQLVDSAKEQHVCYEGDDAASFIVEGSESQCSECGLSHKCVLGECVRVPFGQGDFNDNTCDAQCGLSYVATPVDEDSSSYICEDAAGKGGQFESCEEIEFSYECVNHQCVMVSRGTGTFNKPTCSVESSRDQKTACPLCQLCRAKLTITPGDDTIGDELIVLDQQQPMTLHECARFCDLQHTQSDNFAHNSADNTCYCHYEDGDFDQSAQSDLEATYHASAIDSEYYTRDDECRKQAAQCGSECELEEPTNLLPDTVPLNASNNEDEVRKSPCLEHATEQVQNCTSLDSVTCESQYECDSEVCSECVMTKHNNCQAMRAKASGRNYRTFCGTVAGLYGNFKCQDIQFADFPAEKNDVDLTNQRQNMNACLQFIECDGRHCTRCELSSAYMCAPQPYSCGEDRRST